MDSAVSHDNAKPVYYKRDVIFTCLVVDLIEVDGVSYTVYYAGSSKLNNFLNICMLNIIIQWKKTIFVILKGADLAHQ